ncbi:unnamed protein product [Schistosoma turkestanicum]|nr:unnamed protein product [Schistosoma turkestanicum]
MNRIHCVSNIKTALEFLHSRNVKLVNVNPTDIADGKPAIVLGLIWVIILYFQIEEQEELLLKILDLPAGSLKTRGSAKRALQTWVQEIFAGKYDVQIRDFGPSWRDGIAFNAMVHNIDSSLVEMDKVKTRTPKENLEHAFTQAEKHLGIPRLLDPEDVDVDRPDEKSIVTYVAQFFKAYPDAGRRRSDSPTKTDIKMKFDNLMKFVRESELKIKTTRSSRSSLSEQYQIYDEIITTKEMEEEGFESFKDQWYSGLISHIDSLINPSEVEILEESWYHLTDILNEFLWEIDEKIPGEFGHIAKWLSQTEKWFQQVGLKWYQKPIGTQAMGFSGTMNESWRPSSAEPPYSPPSIEVIDKLQHEKLELFGTNNHKLNSIRDDLSRVIGSEKSINLPSSLIDRLSTRLSKVTGYEPGNSAVLSAAKARRIFLDMLYNVNRTETSIGVCIRSRRRESATGFEHRFCNWLDLVDGNINTETREMVNGILTDYQLCLKTEHVPEKLDQCKSDLSKQFNLLTKIAQYDEQLVPDKALDIIQQWQNDCETKWNVHKFNQLIQLGERIKQRLNLWDKLDNRARAIETWLSKMEDSTCSDSDWFSRRDEIFRLLEEANETAHYLGESADHYRLEMFRKRIEKLEADALTKRRANTEKIEAKRIADKLKLEQEINDHLNKVECWIDSVKELIDSKTSSKTINLRVRCTSNGLSTIVGQLQKVLDQQPQITEHLQNATILSQDSINQSTTTSAEQIERLNHLEEQVEKFSNLLTIKLKDLTDMTEKTYELEKNLNDIHTQVKELEQKQASILMNTDIRTWECSPLYLDFNDCRGHLTFTTGQINDLERALNLQTNRGMAILNKFNVEELYQEIKSLNEHLNNFEKTAKRKFNNKQSINETFSTLKQQMDEIQTALKDLKHATSTGTEIRKENLLNWLENLKTLRRKYTESMKTNDRQCQNLLNSTASQGDSDMLLGEMKMKIFQMKTDLNEQCVEIDHDLQGLDVQLNQSLKNLNDLEEKTKQLDQWLINQERRLTALSTGPTTLPYDNTVDSILERIKSHQQWVDECKNLVESVKKYSQKSDLLPSRDDADSVFETPTSPLSDMVGVLHKRMEHLETNIKKIYNEAEEQLKRLQSFSTQMESTRKWLNKRCNERIEKLNSLAQNEANLTNLMDKLESKQKYLANFTILLNKESETYLTQCQNEIQHLIDSSGHYDTTAIVMLARRELSNFQLELNNIQGENDKELKEIEAKLTRLSKLINNIDNEEKWLNESENKLLQDHNHLNNTQSLTDLNANNQTETDRCNQLLNQINTHSQQIDEHLYPEAQSLEDLTSLQRIDNLRNKLNLIKQNLDKIISTVNIQTKSIHTFQQAMDNFKLNLKNLERQRNSILGSQTISYVNMESEGHLLETSYVNIKKQIEDLRTNQSELRTQFNQLEHLSKSIQPIPIDLSQCQHEMNQFNQKLDQDYTEIQTISQELKQLNQLLETCKNYLKLNMDKILTIIKKINAPVCLNDLTELNELYKFYQNNFDEMKLICQQNLGVELSCESPSNRNRSSKLSSLEDETNQKFHQLITTYSKLTNFLNSQQEDFNRQINEATSEAFDNLTELSQLVNSLNIVLTCSKEALGSLNSIEKEYQNICSKLSTELSNEMLIKSLNNLLDRLQTESGPNQVTLTTSIQNVSSKSSYLIREDILSNSLKQFIQQKDQLVNKMKETIEKCERHCDLEQNFLVNLNELKNELIELSNSLNNVVVVVSNSSVGQNINDAEFERQINLFTEQYTALNTRYKNIQRNFTETGLKSNKVNDLISMNLTTIQKINEHLTNLKQDYDLKKTNFELIQTKLNQCKDQLNKIRLEISRNVNKFTVKSTSDLLFEQILNNFITDLNEYIDDLNQIREMINKTDNSLRGDSLIKKKTTTDLHKLIVEIIDLKNKISSNSLLLNWNDFLNDLDNLLEWIQNTTDELKVIQLDYKKLLTKMEEFEKSFREVKQSIDEKSQTTEIIDITYMLKNQKPTKTKLIHDLESIKDYQMFNLYNDLKFIKQQADRLFTKPQSTTQCKFMDDKIIAEFINRMSQSLELLSSNLNNTIIQYKTKLNDECEMLQLFKSINDWILNYENDLSNIEATIQPIHQQQLQQLHTLLHQHIKLLKNNYKMCII